LNLFDFTFTRLDNNIVLQHFDCDDADINEFLKEDALNYQTQRIANTYLFLNNSPEIVADFYCSMHIIKKGR
jgi:hypothetical protein